MIGKNAAVGTFGIILIIGGALFLINVVGFSTIANRISDSPWLIVALVIGLFLLLKNLKK